MEGTFKVYLDLDYIKRIDVLNLSPFDFEKALCERFLDVNNPGVNSFRKTVLINNLMLVFQNSITILDYIHKSYDLIKRFSTGYLGSLNLEMSNLHPYFSNLNLNYKITTYKNDPINGKLNY